MLWDPPGDAGRPLLSARTIGSGTAACEQRWAPPGPGRWERAAESRLLPGAARATPEPARLGHVAAPPCPPPGRGGGDSGLMGNAHRKRSPAGTKPGSSWPFSRAGKPRAGRSRGDAPEDGEPGGGCLRLGGVWRESSLVVIRRAGQERGVRGGFALRSGCAGGAGSAPQPGVGAGGAPLAAGRAVPGSSRGLAALSGRDQLN